MATAAELHQQIIKRLGETFGTSHSGLGRQGHWSLKPGGASAGSPDKSAINLLAHLTAGTVVVWVFDPHDPVDTTTYCVLYSEQDIDDLIMQVTQRLNRARLSTPVLLEDDDAGS